MDKQYLDNYIDIILSIGLNIQKDQCLVINSPIECSEFVFKVVKKAYEKGAKSVNVEWSDPTLTKLKYQYEDIDNFKTIQDFLVAKSEYQVDENYCFLSLDALDSQALKGIDNDKLSTWQKTVHKYLYKKDDAIMNDKVSWCIASVPTLKWAQEVFPDSDDPVNDLWADIFKMTRADQDNPIKCWEEHINNLEHYAQIINDYQFDKLVFKNSLGTNLEVGLVDNYQFLAAKSINQTNKQSFIANIPTEEVYSMPHNKRTNGKVYASKPLSYNGNLIDEFWFEFKDGEVIDYDAKVGKDMLDSMFSVDEGAKRLGEVALVSYNTPISLSNHLFYTTLYDENASCHIALGKAYPTTMKDGDSLDKETLSKLGCNDSAIHVDFMFGTPDLSVVGVDKNNNEVVLFKEGNFVI